MHWRRSVILAAAMLSQVAFTGAVAKPNAFGGEADAQAFLRQHFARSLDGDETVRLAFADLNGDGRPEAVAYLAGRRWCGSGGCHLVVLENLGRSYRLVGSTAVSRPPISVLSHRAAGWRGLSVMACGGGIVECYISVLRFDGTRYPDGAAGTLEPPAVPAPRGRVLIDASSPAKPLSSRP